MPLRSVLWLHFLRFRFSSVISPLSPVLFPGVLLVAAVITRCGLVRPPPPLNLKRPRLHLRVTLKHVQTVQLVAYLKHHPQRGIREADEAVMRGPTHPTGPLARPYLDTGAGLAEDTLQHQVAGPHSGH